MCPGRIPCAARRLGNVPYLVDVDSSQKRPRSDGSDAEARMNIGKAAALSGISDKMIRHYEKVGLLTPGGRTAAGYRWYGPEDIERLRFVRRARDLGFSIKQIGGLLALREDTERTAMNVKSLASAHLTELEEKIAELQQMADALRPLVQSCEGGTGSNCQILAGLDGQPLPVDKS